ncbi:unnamed protein product, partial [Ectocarpus fasciculatus]
MAAAAAAAAATSIRRHHSLVPVTANGVVGIDGSSFGRSAKSVRDGKPCAAGVGVGVDAQDLQPGTGGLLTPPGAGATAVGAGRGHPAACGAGEPAAAAACSKRRGRR